ncbi:MAG: hypothetical protein WAW37_04545 [Syntrophobacteraceae bacterium]
MKRAVVFYTVIALAVIFFCSGMAMAAERNFQKRIHEQQSRIDIGIKSGKLTPAEAAIVQDNLNHVRNAYERGVADGRLTRREVRRLNGMLYENSKMIKGLKQNRPRRLY